MANLTQIQTGSFTSNGQNFTLNLRGGTNFMQVFNLTQITAGNATAGYKFEWQLGMGGIEYQSNAASTAVNIIANPGGFIPVDTSLQVPLAPIATTASTNAVRPVFSTANTAGLVAGSTVQIYGVAGQPNLSGYQFTVDTVIANTSFRIANALANVPGAVGGAGFYRIIAYPPIFYPRNQAIVNITQAVQAVVTTSVNHNYIVGQSVRLSVPAPFGMTQADGLLVNITAVTAGTFTTDLDTSGFSAFFFPNAAAYPFTPAQAIPVGEETDANSNPNLLDDATINQAILGMVLVAGVDNPAGQNGDVIFWQAGRSFDF
jgi:hypothetical protein